MPPKSTPKAVHVCEKIGIRFAGHFIYFKSGGEPGVAAAA
jgi:hypothetical protein